jgi:formylglycine-generating enzyme required for sulfatase activity
MFMLKELRNYFYQNRLPTEAEWEYAAAADVGQREGTQYKGTKEISLV